MGLNNNQLDKTPRSRIREIVYPRRRMGSASRHEIFLKGLAVN